ncbi:syncytin-A-like [Syngnathus acus]|uniref:syncytin-A-like n=1 Tax=Syngnathus acus TaxID=161584 RepID=UPI0018860BF7|nr:syncytin-A-like [Syngnathus acus]
MAEQAANATGEDCVVCLEARVVLKIVPAAIESACVLQVLTQSRTSGDCLIYNDIFPVVGLEKRKPIFDSHVTQQNMTCLKLKGNGISIGTIDHTWCRINLFLNVPSPLSRADLWLWCGDNKLYDRLPKNASGICALVSLIMPVVVVPIEIQNLNWNMEFPLAGLLRRAKRDVLPPWLSDNDPTYIDAIGVPRGVPDEYKLVNQVSSGFESIFLWITPNKNVSFAAVHEQLAATSLMSFQNRIALDMLLAKEHGVCGMFGDACCTFIPNNTAPGGRLTRALEGLRILNKKMKDHSGVRTDIWSDWMKTFGNWKGLIMSVLVAVAIFTTIKILCGCCCIPCIRSLTVRLIEKTVGPLSLKGQYTLVTQQEPRGEERTDSVLVADY